MYSIVNERCIVNKIIGREKVKKGNLIYNQCLIYALVIGALSIPFLPLKSSNSKRHSEHANAMISQASPSLVLPETIEEAEIQANLQAPPPSIIEIEAPVVSQPKAVMAEPNALAIQPKIVTEAPKTKAKNVAAP